LGRVVAAVPGPIDSARSAGCNLLIRDGGQIIHSIDDALMLYGKTADSGQRTAARAEMGNLEADVWAALATGDATPDVIAGRSGLDIRKVLEGIARLELIGMVQQQLDGSIARVKIA
jgi:DNA processing protein